MPKKGSFILKVEIMHTFTWIFIVFSVPGFALSGVEANEIDNAGFLTSRN